MLNKFLTEEKPCGTDEFLEKMERQRTLSLHKKLKFIWLEKVDTYGK